VWLAAGLSIELMGLRETWNHHVFFDYLERWIAEEQTGVLDKKTMQPKAYKAFPNAFIKDMWAAYYK
ncbi:MAG: hypothetical protein HRU15_11745, partial [Planctomycetes bacterium]|nr:hypothetical protein [Planctomycetota bacterium]